MIKFSEISKEDRPWFISHIETKADLVLKESQDARLAALRFLFFVNAGGAVATASFIATAEKFDDNRLVWALIYFIGGLVCVGALNAFRYHVSIKVADVWIANLNFFYKNEVSWKDLFSKTEEANPARLFKYLDPLIGYCSFASFILGCLLAGCDLLNYSSA